MKGLTNKDIQLFGIKDVYGGQSIILNRDYNTLPDCIEVDKVMEWLENLSPVKHKSADDFEAGIRFACLQLREAIKEAQGG